MKLFDWQGSEVVSGSESSLKLMSTNIPAPPVSLSPSLQLSDSFPSHQGSFRFHLYVYYCHMTQKSIFCVYSNGMESPLVRYLCFHIRQDSFELFWQLLSLRCLSKEFKTSPKGPWLLLPTKLFAYHFFQVCPLLSVAQLCTEEPGEWGPLGSVWALPRPAHVSQFTMFYLVRHTGCPFSTKGEHLQNGFTADSKTDRGREKAFLNSHQTFWFKLRIYIFKTSKFFFPAFECPQLTDSDISRINKPLQICSCRPF